MLVSDSDKHRDPKRPKNYKMNCTELENLKWSQRNIFFLTSPKIINNKLERMISKSHKCMNNFRYDYWVCLCLYCIMLISPLFNLRVFYSTIYLHKINPQWEKMTTLNLQYTIEIYNDSSSQITIISFKYILLPMIWEEKINRDDFRLPGVQKIINN